VILDIDQYTYKCSLHPLSSRLNGFPCECVIACAASKRLDARKFFSGFWTCENYKKQYSSFFPTIPLHMIENMYELRSDNPESILMSIEDIPEMPNRKGRPKNTKRFKSQVADFCK